MNSPQSAKVSWDSLKLHVGASEEWRLSMKSCIRLAVFLPPQLWGRKEQSVERMGVSFSCQLKKKDRIIVTQLLNVSATHSVSCGSQCCSVTKSCPVPCNPMDCSTPGFPILHYLLGFAQNYVHWVSDAIQQFYHLSPPFPPAHNLSPLM